MTGWARVSLADGVVVALLAGGLGLWLAGQWQQTGATRAVIQVGEQTAEVLPLHQDGQYTVTGPLGDSVLEIANGRLRFIEAPCEHRVCLRQGWLARSGETAVCLPNRVHVRLEGGADAAYDSINY